MRINIFFLVSSKLLVSIYRAFFSGFFGGNCRFQPSCSEYAQECLERFSFLEATLHIFGRLARCHPFARSSGYDPVPLKRMNQLRASDERK